MGESPVAGCGVVPHACGVSGKSEHALIAAVQQRLVARYSHLTQEYVAAAVQRSHDPFADCRVREFVPLLVERRAKAQLTQSAHLDAGDRDLMAGA